MQKSERILTKFDVGGKQLVLEFQLLLESCNNDGHFTG
jgi:hypothetical protein